MENRREFLETCFAADRSGLYYTTVSTHLTADDIRYIVIDAFPRNPRLSALCGFVDSIRRFAGRHALRDRRR